MYYASVDKLSYLLWMYVLKNKLLQQLPNSYSEQAETIYTEETHLHRDDREFPKVSLSFYFIFWK